MQLHTLKPNSTRLKKRRIGRGGKRGSFSGRGIKGQKARAGRRIRPEIRDLIKKIPMQKGHNYTGPARNYVAVKALVIAKKFKPGETISPQTLASRRLVRKIHGKFPKVKIVGGAARLSAFTIKNCEVSKS